MTPITANMSATQLVNALKSNFLELGVTLVAATDMSAPALASALNSAFESLEGGHMPIVSSADVSNFVSAVSYNFEHSSSGGQEEVDPPTDIIKLLHVSDLHNMANSTNAVTQCANLLADVDFLMITGDIAPTANSDVLPTIYNTIDSIDENKLLVIAGNHDTNTCSWGNGSSRTQESASPYIKGLMGNNVVFGASSTNPLSMYWRKNIQLDNGHNLVIVGIDQYENTYISRQGNARKDLYTQAQIDWFISVLKSLSKNDYLIVMLHEPPFQDNSVIGTLGESGLLSDVLTNEDKLFISENLSTWNWTGANSTFVSTMANSINMFPKIMNAYLKKSSLNGFKYYNYYGTSSSNSQYHVTINENFTSDPCHFIGFFGGHRHCDIVCPLSWLDNTFDGQMMYYVAAAGKDVGYSADNDLVTSSAQYGYRINEYEINFAEKTVKVTRIGDNVTENGRIRDTITFGFN